MKKKYAIITLSLLLVVASTILLINKSSYAANTTINNCPTIITANTSSDTLTLIEYGDTKITLPKIEITVDGERWNTATIGVDRNTGTIRNQDYRKENELVFPLPTFSNDQYENAYFTQVFMWYMNDLMNSSNYLTVKEKEAIENSNNGKKIIATAEEYEKYGNWMFSQEQEPVLTLNSIDTTKITYYATNDYIETNLITPEAPENYTYVFTNYKVDVTSPIMVVDKNGNEKTDFQKGEGFKLRIPLSAIKNNEINFKANIIGRGEFKVWGEYATTEVSRGVNYYPILAMDCGKTEVTDTFETLNLNYTQQVGNLKIRVIDAETKENLSNAEVVIYDQSGNIVYRYETTGNELNITLPVGEYTVKQIVTPPNYEARVVEQKISITQNREADAVLENIQLIEVPDTSKTATTISVISGLIILVGGIMIIMSIMRKTKNRPSPSNKN